jgi:hypothetical protein
MKFSMSVPDEQLQKFFEEHHRPAHAHVESVSDVKN